MRYQICDVNYCALPATLHYGSQNVNDKLSVTITWRSAKHKFMSALPPVSVALAFYEIHS